MHFKEKRVLFHDIHADTRRLLNSDASSTTSHDLDNCGDYRHNNDNNDHDDHNDHNDHDDHNDDHNHNDRDDDVWNNTVVFKFEDKTSEATFYALINVLNWLAICFIACMSCTICSSNYTVHDSALDPIMLMVDIFLVDISSAFFVMSGFVCAFIYSSIGVSAFQTFRRQIIMFIFVDLWLSGIFAVLFGSLSALIRHQFKFEDVLFTLFEHTSALRLFDIKQSLDAPHTMNLGSWPVQCLVWCLLTVHATYSGNEFLQAKFGYIGSYAIMVSAVCGIVLFTLFGMLHNHSNIFYANSTNFTYRTLEFNLGIHFFYLINMNEVIATTLMRLVHQSSRGILFLFLCIWWSEIGSTVKLSSPVMSDKMTKEKHPDSASQICLRMYPRNQCLRDHHAFLLRGCCLGITLISSFAHDNYAASSLKSSDSSRNKHTLTMVTVYSTAVTFCWPAYEAIQLIFQITFSEQLIERNMALMSVLQPMFLLSGAVLYSLFMKPHISLYLQQQICIAHAHALNLWRGNPTRQQINRGDPEEEAEAGEAGEIGETTNDQELESNLELLDPDEIEDLNAINRV